MFCPQCHAEYRPGFTHCADCEVELVYELPKTALAAPEPPPEPGDTGEDPFVSFWKGDDPRIHAELCQLLSDHDIPHRTIRRQDHLFRISSRTAFEIGIPFSKFEQAEAIIREAYGTGEEIEPASKLLPVDPEYLPGTHKGQSWLRPQLLRSNPEPFSPPEESLGSAGKDEASLGAYRYSSSDGGNWSPDNATQEIWQGESPEMAELLAASLRENQIGSRAAIAGDQQVLFVTPEDRIHACEIVREVLEGMPPE
jgi:hypothetical protein